MEQEEYNVVCQGLENIFNQVEILGTFTNQNTDHITDEIRKVRNILDQNLKSKWLPLPAGFKQGSEIPKKKINAKKSHTFHEWSEAGYRIKKGTRSLSRDKDGAALFKPDQVILSGDRVVARYDGVFTEEDENHWPRRQEDDMGD